MRITRALSLLREERERTVRAIKDLEYSAKRPRLNLIRSIRDKRPLESAKKNE
jgi:hypothetical protein